jgi:hypothetical protein
MVPLVLSVSGVSQKGDENTEIPLLSMLLRRLSLFLVSVF